MKASTTMHACDLARERYWFEGGRSLHAYAASNIQQANRAVLPQPGGHYQFFYARSLQLHANKWLCHLSRRHTLRWQGLITPRITGVACASDTTNPHAVSGSGHSCRCTRLGLGPFILPWGNPFFPRHLHQQEPTWIQPAYPWST